MKNKLLITSALASGLLAGTSAFAQTTVTGDMALVYTSVKKEIAGGGSTRGFGRETQLNIQNKGKLNNGMDYAAGFSLEFDGNAVGIGSTIATESSSISNENVYIDLISGNTTFTVGVDHIQRGYNGAIPQVFHITEAMRGIGSGVTYVVGAATSEAMGFGVTQKVPQAGLSLSAYYAPRSRDVGTNDVSAISVGSGNSSYELGLAGTDSFGIKGLTTSYFYNTADKTLSANAGDIVGKSYGIGYSFGQFAFGYDKFINENSLTAASTAQNIMGDTTVAQKHDQTRIGATFAVDKDLTVGLVRSKTDSTGQTTVGTETVKALQIGYNLGPVAFQGTYATFDNLMSATGPTLSDNGKMGQLRLTTKF